MCVWGRIVAIGITELTTVTGIRRDFCLFVCLQIHERRGDSWLDYEQVSGYLRNWGHRGWNGKNTLLSLTEREECHDAWRGLVVSACTSRSWVRFSARTNEGLFLRYVPFPAFLYLFNIISIFLSLTRFLKKEGSINEESAKMLSFFKMWIWIINIIIMNIWKDTVSACAQLDLYIYFP